MPRLPSRSLVSPLVFGSLVATACGGDAGDGSASSVGVTTASATATATATTTGTGGTGDSGATQTGDGDGDGTATGTATTGADPEPPLCHQPCDAGTPCMPSQICVGGWCEFGCNSAADCVSGNVCVDYGGGPRCAVGCSAPSDCVLAGAEWDEDNWSCEQGGCRYLGCLDGSECSSGLCRPGSSFLLSLFGYAAPACTTPCSVPADCGTGSSIDDADNYECVDGACVWLGCIDDAECGASMQCY